MSGNGTKIGFIVVFLAISIYYLIPTIQYSLEQRVIEDLPEAEKVQYLEENNEKLSNLRDNILALGLDLQGGIHVTLEVGTPQLVLELANDSRDSLLESVVSTARENTTLNNSDFLTEFVTEFESRDPNARLSRYYRSDAQNITRRSTNEEVTQFLSTQRLEAVNRAIEIIRNRVDRFGVTEPSIVKQGNDRIVVELPGIEDKQRVRNLLKGTARLEFRLAADATELQSSLQQVFGLFDQKAALLAEEDSLNANAGVNELLNYLIPTQENPYLFGYASETDTAKVEELLGSPEVQALLPRNTELLWSANPLIFSDGSEAFQLYGVRSQVELTGEVIEEASITFDPATNIPEVSMSMNAEGARRWSLITGANIGKPVAIVLDDYIVSYPNVISKISGGNSSITGLDGLEEAEDLVNILLSGALPAPLDIIEERTVGATLGQASIKAGLQSVIAGLVIVAIFMIIYYRAGGGVADIALIVNILFILGILAAFKATLTLPGMAGIVLTIGMAVDANVLIFDRIREEQRMGKTFHASIEAGYANAMSAIVDANVTTFIVAFILFSFGSGPIKGFAVTLMAGIASSLFSAIIITRVIVDYLTRDRSKQLSFG